MFRGFWLGLLAVGLSSFFHAGKQLTVLHPAAASKPGSPTQERTERFDRDPACGGMAYSAMTPTQAIANPSSYAAFGQEIFFGADTRFGDARRHE